VQSIGLQAVISIISHIGFILISFYGLQSIRFEQFFKPNHIRQVQIVIVFLAIVMGYTVSQFFLEIIAQAKNVIFLVP
jgi:uncharacterized integral membrane protein (TIGR02327 family)